MAFSNHLVHPFQTDTGSSQSQRAVDDLLAGTVKIDGRTLADLLGYFLQLSSHINYYDAGSGTTAGGEPAITGDWQPFFSKSLPFTLAAAMGYKAGTVNEKFGLYSQLFGKAPSAGGLQLCLHYLYYSTIYKVNGLSDAVKGSGLPVAVALEKLIKNKLQQPAVKFIKLANSAYHLFCVKRIDFTPLSKNEAWNISLEKTFVTDENFADTGSRVQQLIAIQTELTALVPSLLEGLTMAGAAGGASLEQSLNPLKDELRKKHPPHLALLFTFLNLFQKLQEDLNGYTKKHLDFFYKDVLQLKAKEAVPDSVHLVFELQKQLKQYVLKKGLLVKAGKDNNNAEINFALDDEIVVNKTRVADLRTLFLNNETANEKTYIEGVYMAPKATAADGVDKEFASEPKNYPTVGGKFSKYTGPGKTSPQPYPPARIGFILASPVLLLQEGTRTVEVTLKCRLDDNCLKKEQALKAAPQPCCKEDNPQPESGKSTTQKSVNAASLLGQVKTKIASSYIYISEDGIGEAVKQGLKTEQADSIRKAFLTDTNKKNSCCEETIYYRENAVVDAGSWAAYLATEKYGDKEKNLLAGLFQTRSVFSLLFSGDKSWIKPPLPVVTIINGTASANDFTIAIKTTLPPELPPVTFFNKENLKEDISTTLPAVKIELDSAIKIPLREVPAAGTSSDLCFLDQVPDLRGREISLYHFFRDVVILDSDIKVTVCGLRNFIVQNDESLQDVNAPIYPFGTRPDVIDFDRDNPLPAGPEKPDAKVKNLIGPNFYVGSREVFCKKWEEVFINLAWKDKPSDFNQYYKAYSARPTAPPENPPPGFKQEFGINEKDFQINCAVLQDGSWKKEKEHKEELGGAPGNFTADSAIPNPVTHDNNRLLFPEKNIPSFCDTGNSGRQTIHLKNDFFENLRPEFTVLSGDFSKYSVNAPSGFVKINLQNQDFLHKDYAFVLARQMMALGKYPDSLFEGAVYQDEGGTVIVFKDFGNSLRVLIDSLGLAEEKADDTKDKTKDSYDTYNAAVAYEPPPATDPKVAPNEEPPPPPVPREIEELDDVGEVEKRRLLHKIRNAYAAAYEANSRVFDTAGKLEFLNNLYKLINRDGKVVKPLSIPIPNEPWTPIINYISLDYKAAATASDIELIHLYPYQNTFKQEAITMEPSLVPVFCDEGTLFIGLTGLIPGSTVNILFQLAEATSDSESAPETVRWHYLDRNQWKDLRPGFEVLNDATDNLTTSGIIGFALPGNMTADNTVMPGGLYWIRGSVHQNSGSVSQAIGICTQAVEATFLATEESDSSRLSEPLKEGSISKLEVADANIKEVSQPYPSFGGQLPEETSHYYVRVSELLRHKGRAIQKFDYERLVLEAFPEIFKAKCITHSFALNAHQYKNDFPYAPGYVLLAVIPDLTRLLAGKSSEPKVPVSIIERIKNYLSGRTSPFVRVSIMNPRYEKINFCLSVKLLPGKDRNYYRNKLKQDVAEFMAPWSVGEYSKIAFGECINKSDIIRFLETRDYLDYITSLQMFREDEGTTLPGDAFEICPLTPRSILIAGDVEVCLEEGDVVSWASSCLPEISPVTDYCKKEDLTNVR